MYIVQQVETVVGAKKIETHKSFRWSLSDPKILQSEAKLALFNLVR